MKHSKLICGIALLIVGICVILVALNINSHNVERILKADCYDLYGNKLINVQCEEKVGKNPITILNFVGAFTFVFGLFHIVGDYIDCMPEDIKRKWKNKQQL